MGEGLLAGGSVRHLALEDAVDPEPPSSAPGPFSDPDDEGAPGPPADGRVMHAGGPQYDGDEDDVNGVEGFVKVVAEEAEGRSHQDGKRCECL